MENRKSQFAFFKLISKNYVAAIYPNKNKRDKLVFTSIKLNSLNCTFAQVTNAFLNLNREHSYVSLTKQKQTQLDCFDYFPKNSRMRPCLWNSRMPFFFSRFTRKTYRCASDTSDARRREGPCCVTFWISLPSTCPARRPTQHVFPETGKHRAPVN